MTTNEPIGVLGVSARAAAFSVIRAGQTPLAADAFADADLRRLAAVDRVANYPADLAAWLAQQTARRPDLPWLYTGAVENYPRLLVQMAQHGRLMGIGPKQVARVRAPFRLARLLADARLAMPATRRTPAGLPTDGSWLKKKRRSAGGSGVFPWTGGQAASLWYFQERIAGLPASAVYVGHRGGAVCYGVTQQLIGEPWTGAHGAMYCGSAGPWPVSHAVARQIEQVGNTIAAAYELRGLFGVDFIVSDETAWVVEVNPRYTASVEILERVAKTPAMQLHLAACRGEPVSAPVVDAGCHGKAILYAADDLLIDNAFAKHMLAEAGDWRAPRRADIPPAGTAIPAGRPVLTVFASAATCSEVEQELRQQAVSVQTRLDAVRSPSCC